MAHILFTKLRGALEFYLFMPGAEKRFRATSMISALKSFLVPLIFLPYGIWALTLTHNTELQTLSHLEGINNFSTSVFISITLVKNILMTFVNLGIYYYFAKLMERKEFFWDGVCAGNWMSVPAFVLSLPVAFLIMQGDTEWMSIYLLACMYILYNLAVSAFTVTRILNIPWELGTAYAIFCLSLGETTNKIVSLIGTHYFS